MSTELLICPLCGMQCRLSSRFCERCGAQLPDASEQAAKVAHASSTPAESDLPTLLQPLNTPSESVKRDQETDSGLEHSITVQANATDFATPTEALRLLTTLGSEPSSLWFELPEGDLPPGTPIDPAGRYRIECVLGKGGFAAAYLARDTRLDRRCVVKRLVFKPSHTAATRQFATEGFLHEAQLLVSLNTPGHPHIPEIYDFFAESRCLVMKYVVGPNLADLAYHQGGSFPLDDALRIIRDVCAALLYMHSRTPEPVLHRDIKPANLLQDSEGRVWLIDFGLAQHTAFTAMPAGTHGYAAPEQWQGRAVPASDVYSLAATLYTLVTGLPLPTDYGETLLDKQRLVYIQLEHPAIPNALQGLLQHALATDPTARPTTYAFLDAIERMINRSRIPLPPRPTPPPTITHIVGREAELAGYQQRLNSSNMVVLTGIAGMGKTTLAAALASRIAPSEDVFWHQFHTGEGTERLITELAIFLAYHGHDDLWATLQAARQSGGTLPSPTALLDYMSALLREEQRTLLIVLDDLHLVEHDPVVRLLCEHLMSEARSSRIRLIIISRTVLTIPGFSSVSLLAGLTSATAQKLMNHHGVNLHAQQVEQLVQFTGGNAQLIVLASTILQHYSQDDSNTLVTRLAESTDIEQFLLSEVAAGLDPQEHLIMRAVAALLDDGGTRDVLEATLDQDVHQGLTRLVARGLLNQADGRRGRIYRQHAILQGFFYEQIGRRERHQFHRRAAAFYDAEEPDPLRAVRHYERANEPVRAAELAVREAWAIVGSGQAQALRSILLRLREQPLESVLRARLLIALGDVEHLTGTSDTAQLVYEQALAELTDAGHTDHLRTLRARACRGVGRLLEVSHPPEALEWLVRGQAELGSANPIEEAELCNKLGGVQIRLGNMAEAQQQLERAEALLSPGPSQLRLNVFHTLGTFFSTKGDLARGTLYTRQAIIVCDQLHDTVRAGHLLNNLALDRLYGGDLVGALTDLQRTRALAERTGNRQLYVVALLNQGLAEMRTGELAIADQTLQQAVDLAQELGAHVWEITGQSMRIDLAIRQHRINDATLLLDTTDRLTAQTGAQAALPELARLRASLAICQRLWERALPLAEHAVTIANQQQNTPEVGMSLRVRGEAQLGIGQHEAALASFAQSVAHLEQMDPYEAALTQAAWGRALHKSDPTRSAALIATARTTFATVGAQLELTRLDTQNHLES